MPLVAGLVAQYPRLDVELKLDDRLVDLTHDRIDVAVRIGQARDSSAVMRKLANSYRILVAAPAYLERCGEPITVADLDRHLCLRYDDRLSSWQLEGPEGEVVEIDPRTRLSANSGDAVQDWAIAGYGVMLKSDVDVAAELTSGRLVHILRDWHSAPAPIYALMPSRRHTPSKTRIFIDALSARLSDT